MKKRITSSLLALCLLAAAILLTMDLISPPAPRPADAPAAEFSAGRAMRDLNVIAREPRPMGTSQGRAAARDYLLEELRKLGLDPQLQKTFGLRVVHPGWIVGGMVENVLARLPGSDPHGAILLMSHYDSVPGGPGAACSGSGVVTVLELARALSAGPRMSHDVMFMLTDGEEPGTIGAHAFVVQHPWFADVRLVINMDQFREGPPVFWGATGGNGMWIRALARTAARPVYMSLPYFLFETGENDLVPFVQAGLRSADILTSAPATEMHTALDLPDIVNPGSVQQIGDHILALVRYLGNQPSLEMDAPDQTFFSVLGRLIHYPTGWSAPLAVAAGLCFLGTMAYGFRKRELTWRGTGLGLVTFLLYLALSIGIVLLLWLGIQALHPGYQYSSYRRTLSDDWLYAVGFFVLTLAVVTTLTAAARRWIAALDLAAGALVIWFPATLALAILLPATGYLATWTLFSGSLALLLALALSKKNAPVWSGLGFLAGAVLATWLWLPVVYNTYIGGNFTRLWMMVGLAAVWLGAMLPALEWIGSPKRWLLPVAALLVASGFLLAGHFLVGRDSPPPKVNSTGYWLDADSGQAWWVAFIGGSRTDALTTARYQAAFPTEMDERQTRLLVDPVPRSYTDLFPQAPPFPILTSTAPPLALDGPRLDVLADEWVGDRRVIKARLTASMHDRLWIIIPPETPLAAITVPNNARAELPPADDREWRLRFDGMPVESVELRFEFSTAKPIQFLIVEEKTGLPSFPGLQTQPAPGTMPLPGEFLQGVPADFTAVYRPFTVPGLSR